MKATTEQMTTIKLELTPKEADFLRAVMQNPIGCTDPEAEYAQAKKLRHRFFDALTIELKKIGMVKMDEI